MKRILFIVNHRKHRSPGQRFRFEQYLQFLESNGYQCIFSPLLNETDDKIFYSKGNYFRKFLIFLKANIIRAKDCLRANKYDIIFLFREAMMTGSTFYERWFRKSKTKILFDFDDSIWLQNVSEANKKLSFLKNADKTKDLIRISDFIIAGNTYLADYALQFNKNITIIPTTIDTEQYKAKSIIYTDGPVVIGWSGSFSTIQHFEFALESLKRIRSKYGKRVDFIVIGDGNYRNEELEITGKPWVAATELQDLHQIDIGIMPLPDDEWAKGKCGLKGLQYMACGIPTIMSPVGVNTEIIQDGENGFLASTVDEWVDKISLLVDSLELRCKFSVNGRKTVEEKYSIQANKHKYLEVMRKVLTND